MKAARIHNFGGPKVIVLEDVPRPMPATGDVLVRVAAAGVGPLNALIRESKSTVSPPRPVATNTNLKVAQLPLGWEEHLTRGHSVLPKRITIFRRKNLKSRSRCNCRRALSGVNKLEKSFNNSVRSFGKECSETSEF